MKQLTLLIVIAFVFSCKDSKEPSYSNKKAVSSTKMQEHAGKKLMETNCYVCHNPTATEDNRIAPPMNAVKKHYIGDNTTKEAFVKSMQDWIENPIKENAKMHGAVKRFGVMPKQVFSEETVQLISEYLFENEIEKPTWLEEHYNKERGNGKGKEMQNHQQGNNFNKLPYKERGLKYALSTKAVLGKNLMGKIQKEGTLAALKFADPPTV